jgi:hypothetical protein
MSTSGPLPLDPHRIVLTEPLCPFTVAKLLEAAFADGAARGQLHSHARDPATMFLESGVAQARLPGSATAVIIARLERMALRPPAPAARRDTIAILTKALKES